MCESVPNESAETRSKQGIVASSGCLFGHSLGGGLLGYFADELGQLGCHDEE